MVAEADVALVVFAQQENVTEHAIVYRYNRDGQEPGLLSIDVRSHEAEVIKPAPGEGKSTPYASCVAHKAISGYEASGEWPIKIVWAS